MVIDDEKAIRVTLKRILELADFTVETARDFQSVKSILNAENPNFDLLLVDLVLPKTNGIDIVKHFSEKYDFDIPVIFLTGEPNLDSAINALRLGAYDYIEKPIKKAQLLEVIEYALQRKKSEDNIQDKRMAQKMEQKLKGLEKNLQSSIITNFTMKVDALREKIDYLRQGKAGNLPVEISNEIANLDKLVNDLELEIKKSNHLGKFMRELTKKK
ncbi:MAG: response regulator [Candidatus Lokiarchaeota archaeon]|nr:response regulator [Candidatus Lokiarchaeota archaeon]